MNAMRTLESAKYVSLRTFRKSGVAVDTPVWCAGDENERLYVFSAGEAGKVKRLRNSSAAQLAVCDFSGKLLDDWVEARAEVIDDGAETDVALAALRKKYGWSMRLADIGSKLTGKFNKRAYIRIELT
jgi:PPOX class probable F420-dependent enzyme